MSGYARHAALACALDGFDAHADNDTGRAAT
jgi:hypothetical protein